MSIRQKMIIWLLLIAVVVVFSNSFFLYRHWMEFGSAAVTDAESTAQALALHITEESESGDFSETSKRQAKVQHYAEHVHSKLKEDIVIVDDKKEILGDAIPEEVGKIFDHDKNDEVGQTIRDGITRTFIERSADFAAGFGRLVVIQVKSEEGEPVGALILEYTSYYDKYRADVIDDLKTNLTVSFIVLFVALVIGYFMARNVTIPIARLKKASDEIAAGNLDVKVEVESKDEFGDLAAAFNTMVVFRKSAEDELREGFEKIKKSNIEAQSAKEFFKSLVGHVQESFYVCDGSMNITYLSPNCELLYGYTPEDFYKDPELWIKAVHPGDMSLIEAMLKKIMAGESYKVEYRIIRRDGVEKWVIDKGSARLGSEGKLEILYGAVEDITERKKSEDKLKRLFEELQEKTEYLERFNRLMVGRELEMIRLKAEVNELLEKAGQPKKYEAPAEVKEL